jgi:hypothetical protein
MLVILYLLCLGGVIYLVSIEFAVGFVFGLILSTEKKKPIVGQSFGTWFNLWDENGEFWTKDTSTNIQRLNRLIRLIIFGIFVTYCVLLLNSLPFHGGFLLGALVYGRYYNDGAEYHGHYASRKLRSSFIWPLLRRWFGHRIVFQNKSNSKIQGGQLYACYPHGMFALNVVLTFCAPNVKTNATIYAGAHRIAFVLPVIREIFLLMGCISIDWKTIKHHIDQKHVVVIIPEGVRGMGKPLPGTKPREGFLKHSHEASIPIVPVFGHNETKIYKYWENEWGWITAIRSWTMDHWGYPCLTFFVGPWPWASITTYIGNVYKRQPSDATVENYRNHFHTEITNLCKLASDENMNSVK